MLKRATCSPLQPLPSFLASRNDDDIVEDAAILGHVSPWGLNRGFGGRARRLFASRLDPGHESFAPESEDRAYFEGWAREDGALFPDVSSTCVCILPERKKKSGVGAEPPFAALTAVGAQLSSPMLSPATYSCACFLERFYECPYFPIHVHGALKTKTHEEGKKSKNKKELGCAYIRVALRVTSSRDGRIRA